jgi:hypothetical protein
MLDLVSRAGCWFFDVPGEHLSFPVDFVRSAAKVGVASLKARRGGGSVFSEAAIFVYQKQNDPTHPNNGRRFVVCWQNFVKGATGFDPIARIVQNTFTAFFA